MNWESAKPIEPGCRAYFVANSDEHYFAWEIVTAIDRVSVDEIKDPISPDETQWEIDRFNPEDGGVCAVPESMLLRIDDPDIQKEIEAEHKKPRQRETA